MASFEAVDCNATFDGTNWFPARFLGFIEGGGGYLAVITREGEAPYLDTTYPKRVVFEDGRDAESLF